MVKKSLFIILTLIFLTTNLICAEGETYTISNSEDWKDVYSTMLYAALQEIGSDFLTSTSHGTTILNGIAKENSVFIVSSEDVPYVFNYADIVNSKGYIAVQEITTENANLDLIEEMDNINNFVIVGDSYGYNAIAVTPYAIKKKSWVFLANNLNIQEIDSILSRRNIDEILIYGYVDRVVRDTLEKYNPKIIDTKDRFKNNIEIVKEYLKINPTTQVLLTNGEFIEKQLMIGTEPTLFTGKENVPDQIRDYLKDSPIKIGILIGNELIGTATNIKQSTGINVMVKFARGARTQTDGISAVEGLDLFPVPTPSLSLSVYSVKYNQATSQLEVTYKSDSNIPAYFKGVITIGGTRVGDTQAIFIAPGNYKTVIYEIENLEENVKAQISTLFGESTTSLDRILEATMDVDFVEILDNCQIKIKGVKYNKQKKEFKIKIENLDNVDCWVNLEISDLEVGYEELTLGTETPEKVVAKKNKIFSIAQELTDEDILQNPFVDITAQYGERENSLVKILKGTFELKTELFSPLTYAITAVGVAIIILIIVIIILRKKDEEGY